MDKAPTGSHLTNSLHYQPLFISPLSLSTDISLSTIHFQPSAASQPTSAYLRHLTVPSSFTCRLVHFSSRDVLLTAAVTPFLFPPLCVAAAMSSTAVERDGFIDTYAALPVERFDEAADDSNQRLNRAAIGQQQSAILSPTQLNMPAPISPLPSPLSVPPPACPPTRLPQCCCVALSVVLTTFSRVDWLL